MRDAFTLTRENCLLFNFWLNFFGADTVRPFLLALNKYVVCSNVGHKSTGPTSFYCRSRGNLILLLFLHLPSAIGSTIALSPILEPVRDLSKGESGLFG